MQPLLFPKLTSHSGQRRSSPANGHLNRSIGLLFWCGAWILGLAGAPAHAEHAAPAQQAPTALTAYKLVDTWSNEPWKLTAGRFGQPNDISSAPDGTVFILDGTQHAVHAMTQDGVPLRVFLMPPGSRITEGWRVRRLDVGFDGILHVLLEGPRQPDNTAPIRVMRLTGDGRELSHFDVRLDRPAIFWDIAVDVDGKVYLSRAGEGNPFIIWPGPTATPLPPDSPPSAAVDIFTWDGIATDIITGPEFCVPTALDVDRDGTVYVVNKCPVPWGNERPGPPPAPPPSHLGAPVEPDRWQLTLEILGQAERHSRGAVPAAGSGEAPRGIATPGSAAIARAGELHVSDAAGSRTTSRLDQPPAQPTTAPPRKVEGVLIYAPVKHNLQEVVPFNGPDDIAVGPAGAYISRVTEIFKLREKNPLYSGPTGRVYSGYFGDLVLPLDVPMNGRLLAGMAHCFFQGFLRFDDPTLRPSPALYFGDNDDPKLEGPVFPMRLAAGEEVTVLQGQYLTTSQPGDDDLHTVLPAWAQSQTVQRWTRQGQQKPPATRLNHQLGTCAGGDGMWTQDVALDGDKVYTIDPQIVQFRPINGIPAWTYWPGALLEPDVKSRLGAISADKGRAAILDLGADAVVVVDENRNVIQNWPIDGVANTVPVDLALDGDTVYLADTGRNRIMVRDLDGGVKGEFAVHDGPVAIDVGPTGDVFVLGRGGWAFRYRPDGTLVTAWPLDDFFEIHDISVDVDGRVYIPFYERIDLFTGGEPVRSAPTFDLGAAGVWVYEETVKNVPPPTPRTDACLAIPDKRAAPYRIPLGAQVQVELTVSGRCPGAYDPVQMVMAFDTSRSMNQERSMVRAQAGADAVLAALDTRFSEVALVSFDNGSALSVPLTRELGLIRSRVNALQADGDTRMAAGLDTALAELTGPRGSTDPKVRKMVLLFTDGVFKDAPQAAADALTQAGIELYPVVYTNNDLEDLHVTQLRLMAGDPKQVLFDPDTNQLETLVQQLTRYRPEPGLFETITIQDVIPANMTYVANSAVPTAQLQNGNTLVWTLGPLAASQPIRLTYNLIPQEVGVWPTNVVATADYKDALKNNGRLIFPIPEVEVYDLSAKIYLPIVMRQKCNQPKPLDVVLVLDTSSSMREPAGDGRTKLQAAQDAARQFLGFLDLPIDHAGIVAFNRVATRMTGLTGDRAQLQTGLDSLASDLGTRIDLGLNEAIQVFKAGQRPDAKAVVVLLTDGLQNDSAAPVRERAAALKAGPGAIVYTIGLGSDIDRALLEEVATSPDRFFNSPAAADLEVIYRQIAERLECEGLVGILR